VEGGGFWHKESVRTPGAAITCLFGSDDTTSGLQSPEGRSVTRMLVDEDLVDNATDLVRPVNLVVDQGLSDDRARHMIRIAQLLYTFWNTGEMRFLTQAVDASFVDRTLPPGRPQGPPGPVAASASFRSAVPDLTCELSDLLVAGAKLAVRLRFRGHFTGRYNGIQGSGQEIDFVAFDIQHVGADKIVEDWHLEDNLTFLLQAGLVTVAQA
jgi:predicted ester cyclase